MSKRRYYAVLALLLVAGIAAASIDVPGLPKTDAVIHALADALMIAALLSITVDTYLKKCLLKEASLDIFQFMLGYPLPRGVTDRVKALVEKSTLLRRDCELRWSINWTDEDKAAVWTRLEVTYLVENLSYEDKRYEQKTTALDPNDPDTRVDCMWCHCWKPEHDYHLEGASLVRGEPDAAGDRWIRGKSVLVPPRNRDRELECKFGARYTSRSQPQDDDQYTFTVPTLNVRVVVEAPPELLVIVDPKADRSHVGNAYEYSRLFVDNESVTLRWRTRD